MRWEDLAPREKRLLLLLAVVAVGIVLVYVPILINQALSSREDDDQALRDAIEKVQGSRGIIRDRDQRKQLLDVKYGKKTPKLGGYLEQLANEQGLEAPETQDRPDIPLGKNFTERSMTARFHKIGGYPMLRIIESVEQSGYPVAITRLGIRKRGGEHDSYDMEIGLSAYDRKGATEATAASSASAASSSSPPGLAGKP